MAKSERVVGHISQVPRGEGRNFELDGTVVTVFHTRTGAVFARQSRCPHRQGPLADGLLGGARIEADHVVGDLIARGKVAQEEQDSPIFSTAYTHLKAYESRRDRNNAKAL